MTVDAVISDFGGVLTTPLLHSFIAFQDETSISMENLGTAMQRIAERDGSHPLFELEKGLISEADFLNQVADELEPEIGHRPDMHSFAEIYFEALEPNAPMIELMRELQVRGLRMALLTNNVREWESRWRTLVPIDEIFELVVDSAFVGCRKPEPRIYEILLERLAVEPAKLSVRRRRRGQLRGGPRTGNGGGALPRQRAGDPRDPRRRRPLALVFPTLSPLLRTRPLIEMLRARLERSRVEPWMLALGAIVLLALGLRLWGIKYGLPFAYQIDEERIYVRKAARMLDAGSLNPHYMHNPPLLTYLLQGIYAIRYGGSQAHRLIGDVPDREGLFLIGRVVVALIGTVAVWLAFVAGRRLFDRRVGIVAALLMAVAFLPVFYSHVALNNVPAMTAALASLCGTAAILRRGATRDYVLAGAFVGVAAATKYLDGIVVFPMLTAIVLAPRGPDALPLHRGLAIALGSAAAAFALCNPFAVIKPAHFVGSLGVQGEVVGQHKFGQDPERWADLLPAHLHLGPGLGAGDRCDRRRRPARPRGSPAGAGPAPGPAPVHPLYGTADALLRALDAARLPDRLPARRLRGGTSRGSDCGAAAPPADRDRA